MNSYSDLVNSLCLDIRRGVKISFLFGSAVSISPDRSTGVPGVAEINEIVKDFLDALGIYEEFSKSVSGKSAVEIYQEGFKYILKIGDQSMIQEVMGIVMSKAKNEHGHWLISKGLQDFAKLIMELEPKPEYILTTNFDPLIEQSLNNVGVEPIILDLVIDQPIQGVKSLSSKINVVHLHGLWESDTMHSSLQLEIIRPKISTSLRTILAESKLYVLGYSGWDDEFVRALGNIVHEYSGTYNIRWAFRDDVPERIETNYKKLLDTVSLARANGRFQGYCNVDFHSFFEDVYEELKKKGR